MDAPRGDLGDLSELVRAAELTAEFRDENTIQHKFYLRGTDANGDRRQGTETWLRVKHLGSGAYSSVWLEECKERHRVRRGFPSKRAVKKVILDKQSRPMIQRELETIFTFSQAKVRQ
jgi:hypothetical protein